MKLRGTQNSLVRRLRRVNIQARLLATFLALSLVPTIFIGLYAYNVYTGSINTKLADSSEQTIKQLNKTLETELDKALVYISSLSISSVVQDGLANPKEISEIQARDNAVAIRELITDVRVKLGYMKNIRVADRDGNIVFDLGYDDIPSERYAELLEYLDEVSPRDGLMYANTYRSSDVVMLGRKVYHFSNAGHLGYIFVYLNESDLRGSVYSDISFGEDSTILLLDRQGAVLSSDNTEYLGQSYESSELIQAIYEAEAKGLSSFRADFEGEDCLVVFDYNQSFGSYFVATIPQSYIAGETRQITQNLLLVVALLIVVSFGITLLVYLSIIQPIRRIVDCCNVVADEDIEQQINDDSPDELGFLARTIDHIIAELKGMAYEWQDNQRRKRELELEMLRYQINPHFLFNTLNTLKWVAVMNDVPVLSEGMSSLSSLLQSTLIREDEFITIGEEVENLKHYFSIQNIRYAGSFDVVYELDKGLTAYRVPRFILQPIAENSIIHGTADDGRAITITVGCAPDGEGGLWLTIQDNGQGFDTSDMDTLPKKERFSGIGLTNVDERLRLYFGADYGLVVQSEIGEGTVCRIHVPKSWLEKEGQGDV